VTKRMGSAFGYGVSRNMSNMYEFLIDNFEWGDHIFLFGFSRGSYTVRALAALIHCCGVLRREHRNLVPYAIELFKREGIRAMRRADAGEQEFALPVCEDFRQHFSRWPRVHFMGLWDTVTSIGSVYNPLKLPFTTRNPGVDRVRHAISI